MIRKTKIVCTIGPATDTEEMLAKLFDAGMNITRHNFSHGTHETHGATMARVRKVAKEKGVNYAIMLDTKGPEIRAKKFKNGRVLLKEGSEVTIVGGQDFLGDETRFAVTLEDIHEVLNPGNHILLNDGLVDLEVTAIEGEEVRTIVRNTGEISDNKSSNLPGVVTNLPPLTEQDKLDLAFGVKEKVDFIAASFIRKGSDILEIRRVLQEAGGQDVQIIAKIENQEGVNNIDEILRYSDGIMVARGDMGVEIPIEQVPVIQKKIIEKCNAAGKPVITATQMLDSMVRNPRPTRAEVSDVANAILDGSDCVMLSGETASGAWPLAAVKTMADICMETENSVDYNNLLEDRLRNQTNSVQSAISVAAVTTANRLEAKAIITGTQSGSTARNVAKFKPHSIIIAATPSESVARKLSANWGVYPVLSESFHSTDELIEKATQAAKDQGYIDNGDLVVISAGIPISYVGSTNMLHVKIVGDVLIQGEVLVKSEHLVSGLAVFAKDAEEAQLRLDRNQILVVPELKSEYMGCLHEAAGIIVEASEVDSDIATRAQAYGVPIITGAKDARKIVKDGALVVLDGKRGLVIMGERSDS